MHKKNRMTNEDILNAANDDVFDVDLSSLLDEVISAQNPDETQRLSRPLKTAISIRLLRGKVKAAEAGLTALRKKIDQKRRDETYRTSKDFGALELPPGDFTIPASSYGAGGDLSALYRLLQRKSRVHSSTSEYVNLFNKFIHHVVTEMYSGDVWPRLTGPRKGKTKNAMYENAKKGVRASFYVDVFNMITVALTNFRRNMKSQEAGEQYSSAAVESDKIPSRPSSQNTDGGL